MVGRVYMPGLEERSSRFTAMCKAEVREAKSNNANVSQLDCLVDVGGTGLTATPGVL